MAQLCIELLQRGEGNFAEKDFKGAHYRNKLEKL